MNILTVPRCCNQVTRDEAKVQLPSPSGFELKKSDAQLFERSLMPLGSFLLTLNSGDSGPTLGPSIVSDNKLGSFFVLFASLVRFECN